MREIEFLPAWYPSIQQRYRWVALQGWFTVLVMLLISGYSVTRRMQTLDLGRMEAQTQSRLDQSRHQLVLLDERLKLEGQLRQRDHIAAGLGAGVETTRLLKSLEDAMTPAMALTNLSLSTVEADRRMKVTVDGVAPSENEPVTLLDNLLTVKCFENVAIQLKEGKLRQGHINYEFEVTFELDLGNQAESVP